MKNVLRKLEFKAISPEESYPLAADLEFQLEPLIFSIKKEYWKKLNLPEESFRNWFSNDLRNHAWTDSFGDLIFNSDGSIYFFKIYFQSGLLEAGMFSKEENAGFENFCNKLTGILSTAGVELVRDWIEVAFPDEIAASINGISKVITPSPLDSEASQHLEDETNRNFLEIIVNNSGSSINKILSPEEFYKMTPVVDIFEKLGIITKDFVVLCSKTGQPILKVPSRSVLEETPQGNNKCFICGNPLSKETIDEIISVSDFGTNLLKDGYWFQVRMLNVLSHLGVPLEQIRVWTDEGSISYIFSIISSQPYLFVLCPEDLKIEDIYRINIYVSAYSIENLLIVSTEKISMLFKNYMQESNADKSVAFIETLDSLEESVELYITDRDHEYITNILASFISYTPINVNELISYKLSKSTQTSSPKAKEKDDKPKKKHKEDRSDKNEKQQEKQNLNSDPEILPDADSEEEESLMVSEKM